MAGVDGGAPYYIETLDPREAFVIYSSRIRREPMAGVILQVDENDRRFAVVYTKNKCFTVTDDSVTEEDHILGEIPLVEYIGNMARMACFEAGLSIQNAINELESNALDAIKDFVNGFDVFSNCEIDDGSYKDLSLGGKAVKIKTVTQGMEAKVYRIVSELNQSGVQQRIDDLTDKYMSICGIPLRSGGESTSDTGTATIFRNGWYEIESRAKDFEKLFKRSERRFLKLVLNILDVKAPIEGLELKDIDISFGRENLNNLQSRFQCLCEALANDKIHPLSAFGAFGDIFGDKTRAYQMGMEWYEKNKAEEQELLDSQLDAERERIKRNSETTGTVPSGGRGHQETEPDGSFAGE
jgi:SPP1 family phage portal protein